MKWHKLGQLLEFDKSPFSDRFASHAQSPQALMLQDRVRIYFSTRKIDSTGKFLSYVQYVDFDFEFKKLINHSEHEIMPLGELGCFDEHGIFPLSPAQIGDKIYGYTNGISRRVSVDVESGIGLAFSTDGGETFQKHGDGPVVSTSLFEPFLVGDAFVRVFDNTFHMFYIFGKKWSEETKENTAERVYKIGHATSTDGISWKKTGRMIIADKIDENECQALPTVLQIGERFHMYFCYRHMTGFRTDKTKGYRLGYAYSDDLVHWTRSDDNAGIQVSDTGWDSDMMCYPNMFKSRDDIYLIYNGNDFGRNGFGIAKLENV